MSLLSRLLKRDDDRATPTPATPPEPPPPVNDDDPYEAEVVVEMVEKTDPNLVAPVSPPPPPGLAERAAAPAAALRSLMLELRWTEATSFPLRWVNLVRPEVQVLRSAATGASEPELAAALGKLSSAFDGAARGAGSASGAVLSSEGRQSLLDAYEPLQSLSPGLFSLEEDLLRREPVIVQCLLAEVPELDPLMTEKLTAVGLGRLENLLQAGVEEIACVAGIPESVAGAVAEKVAEFKRSPLVAIAAAGRRPLETLLARLEAHHQSFERAAAGWSPDDVAAKRRARREREQAYLALRTGLARLGDVMFIEELEKLPYGRRIEELARLLRGPGAALTERERMNRRG